ncbi:hypothetical protein P171DRAFT_484661 [Karstenula rhodostoma CBS 690.94]|uniref:RapZ C-terminal domain-containing protein n=1 Tax=Karstenula rhodostoma CBS 690.94 TaxID=1392251 RepID=A0A9P4PMH5_9PLEO|nr:hypothetical protein P171DRAFT_484661 [Karstenula rhodostoma CBS 690.94]
MLYHERQTRGHARPPVQPRWPDNAHYAPNYPIYPLKSAPAPLLRVPLAPAPAPAPDADVFVPRLLERFERMSPPPWPIEPQLRRKVSIPKKQVSFNLPARSPTHRHPPHKPSQAQLSDHAHHRHPTPANLPRRRPSTHNLGQQPAPHPPRAPQPTIWIVTYAHTLANTPAAVHKILATQLPPGTPHLYSIHAYNLTPPPAHICEAYSGVSPIVQNYVMRDPRARKAVADAIHNILAHGRREMRKEKEGRGPAKKDVALSVCCLYGTHRSVSIAERIAQGLMDMKLGVNVVVRHVHRVKGAKDPR